MTFLTAKELWCDGCGEWLRLDTGRIADQWVKLKKEGWTRCEGKHYCPDCTSNNKNKQESSKQGV